MSNVKVSLHIDDGCLGGGEENLDESSLNYDNKALSFKGI